MTTKARHGVFRFSRTSGPSNIGRLLAIGLGAVLGGSASPIAAQVVTLTPIGTPFNQIIGIDCHLPTNKVVVSVNYSTGQPYNFELIASNGSRTQFSGISGLTDEVKIATVKDGLGGFTVGDLFTGTGVPGQIAHIAWPALTVTYINLPAEPGLMRGSMYVDRTSVFGGDLIAVSTVGGVWRVTSGGVPTQLASLGTHLEGVITVANDPAKYGPWAGKILAGAEQQGRVYAIAADGSTTFYLLGMNPEDFDLIPANENFFGVGYADNTLYGAPPAAFAGMAGDILITQESPGQLWQVRWDGSQFQTTLLAQVQQWEHVTFCTAGIIGVPPIPPVPTASEWGLGALAVLLLSAVAIKFGRRRVVTA